MGAPRARSVPPELFIDQVEQSGPMIEIGRYVLPAACRPLACWSRSASTSRLTLSVNISARQLRDPDFNDIVEFGLLKAGDCDRFQGYLFGKPGPDQTQIHRRISMRVNTPITGKEHEIEESATLMSTTDCDSYITYANAAFRKASGYEGNELLGQPHNIVRHPDMPKEAFADMWRTLKGGEPWTALVKNRRKNGDHYWVRANAIPVIRRGKHEGYMSVRTKPGREEIEQAEALYKAMREGGKTGRKLHKGVLLKTGLGSVFTLFKTLSVRGRLRLNVLLLWLAWLGSAWAFGDNLTQFAVMAGLASGVSAMLCAALEWQFARPLELLRQQALDVATGNNRNVQTMDRVDEIGMTMRTISQLGLMFRWLIDDVSDQVIKVQQAISEIAQGNMDLAARTEDAASSVEETASAMEEMTATVKNNADTTDQANALSSAASQDAVRGSEAMAAVVHTMNEIADSSKRIVDIIGVIDGIAFQTNILALNAAVEAARAGTQGRGFAVVASEVRALARRSADAAKEIKSLIDTSVVKVDSGLLKVDDAGQTIQSVVQQAKRVSDLMAEISTSTREQSAAIAQVGRAVMHMDHVTQQNAALVEQSAAASSSVGQQASQLVAAVRVFR